jgi:tetratricopeptide (TPR) repeat protein
MEAARPGACVNPEATVQTAASPSGGELSQSDGDFGLPSVGGADPLVGQMLGDVELVRAIGEGGMGRVYEGRQRIAMTPGPGGPDEFRRVAVKVLKGPLASDELRLRFAAEARLLARLDHPGIARIHGAGTHLVAGAAVPAIVMEFIPDALPLVDYATRHRLAKHQRVAVFREVCAAVAEGHLKGVIHRDLKPGNILVAGSGPLAGRPRVIDFGIARATDADTSRITRQSETPRLLGTLQYMSPEQFAGDPDQIDVRSDVYSLGVVLYELLTGQPPYDVRRKTAFEAARIVRDEDPTPLSSLDRTLSRDVAAIATKCLEKHPARRYSSAAELADDLGRHLEGRPVAATPPGLLDGLWRLARRHRAAAAVALTALAAGAVALVGIGGFAIRAERQRRAATAATQRAERAKAAAEDLVQFMTFNLRDRLTELGRPDLMADVLDRLARYHDARDQSVRDGIEQPSARQRRQREVFLNTLGDLHQSFGRLDAAAAAYGEAFETAAALAAEAPASLEFQRDLSVSHQKLGMLAADRGDSEAAGRHFLASREIRERLVSLAPRDPTREWDLAGSLDRLGQLALDTGDLAAARREFTALAAVMQRLTAIDPANLDWRRDLAIAEQKVGCLEARGGDRAAAERHLDASIAILTDLVATDGLNRQWQWDLAASLRHRGAVAADAEDWTTARDRGRRGLEIADRLAADATGPQAEVMQLGLLRQLAECHRRLGEAAEAAACEARLDGLQLDPAVSERNPND